MEKIALLGGKPIREKKLFYGRQWIDESDIAAVNEVLRSDFLTGGPAVEVFEKKLQHYTGAKYSVAVSSGTAALHCACIAAEIGPGDEVIVAALTFMPSANCVLYCGGKPVFADIDPETLNIDTASIVEHITPYTKAIIAVDFAGQPVAYNEIREVCDEYGLIFIEDAAHSLGSEYNGKKIGSLADLTCFSFHPVKTITGGEGGAVTTDNEAFYKRLLLARNHGMTRDETQMEEVPHEGPWYNEQLILGYNYRLTDMQCALLSSQLERIDNFIKRRKEIMKRYDEAFGNMTELQLPRQIQAADTCCHIYIVNLQLDKLSCTRREFYDAMSAENVQCHVQYVPVYWHPYYKKLGYTRGLCPNTEKIYSTIMTLPLYPKMTDQDVEDVINAVKKVAAWYSKLS